MLLGSMAAGAQTDAFRYDEAFPFVVVTGAEVDSLPTFSDQEFYEHSNSIIFEVNETDIHYDDPFFDLYYTRLLPYINERHLQLRKVFVRGAASPEGSYEGNRLLGKARSHELLTLLRKGLRYQYVVTSEEVCPITEDYGYLCILMREANDPDYSVVQSIYDECQGDEVCCKTRLMAAQNGRLWRRLISDYYPRLRAARFMLWFSEPDAEHAPASPVTPANGGAANVTRTHRDTIYINDTLFIHRPVVLDSIVGYTPMRGYRTLPGDTILRHPLFAVKTNLLFDLGTFLNAEVEVPLRRRGSILAEVVWPWWLQRSHNRWCCEMGSVSLEGRWWFRPWQYHSTFQQWHDSRRAPLTRGFLGAYVAGGYYDFQLPKTYDYPEGLSNYSYYRKGRQGEFLSAGLTLGVARSLGRHMRLEASLGVGAAYTEYRTYHVDANSDVETDRDQHLWRDEHNGAYDLLGWMNFHDHHPRSNARYLWIGPTKAKLSLVWLLSKPCRKGSKKGGDR